MNTVTLHCETGNHDWERPSQRGRRPHSCPACLGAAEQTREPAVASTNVYEQQAEVGLDLLDRLDSESQRVVEYAISEILSGTRSDSTCAMHAETIKHRCRQFA